MMNLHHDGLKELGEDLPKAVKVFSPSNGKFISLEEAMTKDGQLGDVNWKDIPDLTAILEAKQPDYPKPPLEKCVRSKGGMKKKKKSDAPMEDALEDVSVMEELEDEIQDVEEDIDDFV